MNASDILKYGNQTFLRSLENVPQSEWEKGGVCGVWSVKDIVAHLASYELVLCDILGGFIGSGPTPHLDQFKAGRGFNDSQVEMRKGKSSAEVLAEYNAAHAEVMRLIAQLPTEKLREPGTLPWYGMEYALDDFLVYTYYGHKREHSAQVDIFRDKPLQG
jgi:uncharacterized damage-inducible protein DinB